ncbi:hypothetical protein C8R46DRAFT_1326306 [Mycena filopes]|nr:hypothetical protein C8R46DRAFT_1326306 [Mycena filopes]
MPPDALLKLTCATHASLSVEVKNEHDLWEVSPKYAFFVLTTAPEAPVPPGHIKAPQTMPTDSLTLLPRSTPVLLRVDAMNEALSAAFSLCPLFSCRPDTLRRCPTLRPASFCLYCARLSPARPPRGKFALTSLLALVDAHGGPNAFGTADILLRDVSHSPHTRRPSSGISRNKYPVARVLHQDKRWFDARAGVCALKDGDDACELLAGLAGQVLVVGAMFSVHLVSALLAGWLLALAGSAFVPVFTAAMHAQAGVASSPRTQCRPGAGGTSGVRCSGAWRR